MKKRAYFLAFAFLLLVLAPLIVSADGERCCLELANGASCQEVTEDECANGFLPNLQSCVQVSLCQSGTCINEGSGECSIANGYICDRDGGIWDSRPQAEVDFPAGSGNYICQQGCCFFGNNADLMTGVQCYNYGTEIGIETIFDASITSEGDCVSQSNLNDEGACLYEPYPGVRSCYRGIKGDCLADPSYLGFTAGRLCTDITLGTNCAKSETTNRCGPGGKVYFTDTCGNLANVYDESKWENTDYWTYIKSPQNACQYSGDSDCGNCKEVNYDLDVGASICRDYYDARENEAEGNLQKPEHGDYVCATLNCLYDTDGDSSTPKELYLHGEEWCAETEGSLLHIQKELNENKFIDEDAVREELENYNKYNVPGSKYVQLTCVDGEAFPTPCNDFRDEICMEFKRDNGFKEAACIKNNWKSCLEVQEQSECEGSIFCQWIPGYRFDFTDKVTQNKGGYHDPGFGWNDGRRQYVQGSCVPLFAPGFQFWGTREPEEGEEIEELPLSAYGIDSCLYNSSIVEPAIYQLSLLQSRNNFDDQDTCITVGGDRHQFDGVGRCIENCYVIPNYGKHDESASSPFLSIYPNAEWNGLKSLYEGGETYAGNSFEHYCISDRKANYCYNRAGEVGGDSLSCASDEDLRKEFPVFFTNQEWLQSITLKTKYMGDCGYKQGIYSESLEDEQDVSLEEIWVAFTKLDSNGDPKDEYDFDKIYEGYKYTKSEYYGEGINIPKS